MRLLNRLMLVVMLLSVSVGSSQSIFGKWKTIDDRTGNPKAIIDIYEEDGKMYGKVLKIVEKGKEDSLCTKCDGDLKDTKVWGTVQGGRVFPASEL